MLNLNKIIKWQFIFKVNEHFSCIKHNEDRLIFFLY